MQEPDRILPDCRRLLIRPGAIGDFLLSLPALESLQSRYTEVWCAEQNVPLARFADRAMSLGAAGLDRIGLLPSADVFDRLSQFDEIHSWYGSNRSDFQNEVSGFPFVFHAALPANSRVHATQFYCDQVGARVHPPQLLFATPRESFVVMHPFASNPAKQWPLENFRGLASLLSDVRFCAGSEDVLDDAVRISDLAELGCWLSRAKLFIGNDSGITHLAAAVGTPVIALFGPTDPAVWAPLGKHVAVTARMPLSAISPEEILGIARGVLRQCARPT